MDPTYNVALTERQIRALKLLAEMIAEYPRWSPDTREFHRQIAATLTPRLKQIEAEKGESRGHDSRP